jgi:hypothetical protein
MFKRERKREKETKREVNMFKRERKREKEIKIEVVM